jgi:hypothetical protein
MRDEENNEKQPIEMTTDEAMDYVFGPEIAEELKRQARKCDEPEEPESEG